MDYPHLNSSFNRHVLYENLDLDSGPYSGLRPMIDQALDHLKQEKAVVKEDATDFYFQAWSALAWAVHHIRDSAQPLFGSEKTPLPAAAALVATTFYKSPHDIRPDGNDLSAQAKMIWLRAASAEDTLNPSAEKRDLQNIIGREGVLASMSWLYHRMTRVILGRQILPYGYREYRMIEGNQWPQNRLAIEIASCAYLYRQEISQLSANNNKPVPLTV